MRFTASLAVEGVLSADLATDGEFQSRAGQAKQGECLQTLTWW
jgi:hypothetical protein